MCGIIGYIGYKKITPLLIDGLQKMEYRGYDSVGLCLLSEEGLAIFKKRGKVSDFAKELKGVEPAGPPVGEASEIGIAHTRWATHGEPNETNAHPHLDCQKAIAIVHNGIIENHHALRDLLEQEGHEIISETDSEIIAHLIEKFYQGNLEEAVIKALKLVEGAFGLAIIHKDQNKIIAARRGSPLIIGLGDGEMFVASDAAAILNHTKKVIYLEDNQIAVIEKNNYQIKNLNGDCVDGKICEIQWTIDQIEKGDYQHFMLKEIMEQPEAISNALAGRIKDGLIKLTLEPDINLIKRIIIVACGTSWHAGLIGKYLIEKMARLPVEVDYASEFRYRDPIINETDLVVAISQSGETADTLAAIKEAKSKGAKTIGIVNVVGSSIAREVGSGIYLHAGPEIGVASTKAFTCQVIALLLLTLYIEQVKGKKLDQQFLKDLNNLPEQIKKVLPESNKIRELAEKFKDSRNFLYLGRGLNFPVALEGALKLKEISYIHAEGYPAAEMKHGPIALIDANMPVVCVAPQDENYEKMLSNMAEIKARKGELIAITDGDDSRREKITDNIIKVPRIRSELSPIINVIPLQLLAYHIADLKGLDVDKPRNLAKSVTVE
ncbi:MAG: glutamine--fructose-6-phosphate transaminase (isomerizing) [bacterium]